MKNGALHPQRLQNRLCYAGTDRGTLWDSGVGQHATLCGTLWDSLKNMAKVSITAAAKLAGVSRSTLYRSYIDKGLLSVSKDQKGKRCIDTSELLRVFGAFQGEAEQGDTSDSVGQSDATHSDSVGQSEKTPQSSESALALELKLTKKQLEESLSREEWYKKKIDDLTDTMKLLEHKPNSAKPTRRWWQFMWK